MRNRVLISALFCGAYISAAFAIDLDKYINNNQCSQVINNSVFTSCYDYGLKGTRAVAYTIDGVKLNNAQVYIAKRPAFYPDYSLPVKYRSYPEDYTHSGYDKGHMANHADFDYSANLVYQTYALSNVVPQNPTLNRQTWLEAERYERSMAKQFGSVNVINLVLYSEQPQRIGKHKIAVPNYFYKIIYNNDRGFAKCFGYQNNEPVSDDNLTSHSIDCKKL